VVGRNFKERDRPKVSTLCTCSVFGWYHASTTSRLIERTELKTRHPSDAKFRTLPLFFSTGILFFSNVYLYTSNELNDPTSYSPHFIHSFCNSPLQKKQPLSLYRSFLSSSISYHYTSFIIIVSSYPSEYLSLPEYGHPDLSTDRKSGSLSLTRGGSFVYLVTGGGGGDDDDDNFMILIIS
jgi:hypothetical protein